MGGMPGNTFDEMTGTWKTKTLTPALHPAQTTSNVYIPQHKDVLKVYNSQHTRANTAPNTTNADSDCRMPGTVKSKEDPMVSSESGDGMPGTVLPPPKEGVQPTLTSVPRLSVATLA